MAFELYLSAKRMV